MLSLSIYREYLKDDPVFYVPEVITDLSSREVLTTELVSGVTLDKLENANQETRNFVSELIVCDIQKQSCVARNASLLCAQIFGPRHFSEQSGLSESHCRRRRAAWLKMYDDNPAPPTHKNNIFDIIMVTCHDPSHLTSHHDETTNAGHKSRSLASTLTSALLVSGMLEHIEAVFTRVVRVQSHAD